MKDFPAQYDLKDEDVLYFSHIPKTAGMTFRTILEDQFHSDDVCPATLNAQLANYSQADYEKYRLFRGHLAYVDIPQMLSRKNLLLLTVLREPVARVISHYDYIRRMPGDPHYNAVKNMTLEEFAQSLPAGKVGKNIQTYYVAKLARFDLNHLPPDEVFAIAQENLNRFAFVGILEQFQESLFLLSYIFGWNPILNSRRENSAGDNKSKADEIPTSTIELIKQNSLLDMELYQYAKGLFETRFAEMQQDLLANYGTTFTGATISQPLSLDSMSTAVTKEVLERHAEQRFLNLNPTISSSLSYDFLKPLRGTGWHRRESLNQQSGYRWIGPEPTATLDFPVPSEQDAMIEIRTVCNYATTSDVAESLTLEVNGHPIKLDVLYSDRGSSVRWFQGTIPKSVLDHGRVFSQFNFRVNRVVPFTAVNPLNPDPRVVGLAINSLKIFPTQAATLESETLSVFKLQSWKDVADFVEKHLEPGEKIAAPLIFKLRLPAEVINYQTAFDEKVDFQWVILYKGTIEYFTPILLKLFVHRFSPVFADGNFVIFARRRGLPTLSYLTLHVRTLYEEKVTVPLKQYTIRQLKQIKSFFIRRSNLAKVEN